MKTKKYAVKVTFTEAVLGSQPGRDVVTQYIAAKNGFTLPDDEAETLVDALERGTTMFHTDPVSGKPVFWNYQVKGFLKNAAQVLNGRVDGGVKNLKSKVNNLVFVGPRMILLTVPKELECEVDILERPLRAETALGPRVALARSEKLPAGTYFYCELEVYPGDISESVLRELFEYGRNQGLGQWRNGGWGTFAFELELVEEE